MSKFNEQAYNEGRADFANGMSLREIAESIMTAPAHTQDEDRVMSRALGFADALLDQLRHPPVAVEPKPPAA